MARPRAIVSVKEDPTHLKWLLYGPPGCGKSALAAEAPEALIVLSAMDELPARARKTSTAQKWVVSDWSDMTEVYEYMRHDGCRDFKFCIFDSVTLFQELGLDNIMRDLVAAKSHRKLYLPDKGEYGQNMNRISLWMRDMKSLPINFIVIAHDLRQEDEDSGNVTYMPAIQGRGMPQKFSGYMGLVTYMTATAKDGKMQRTLYTRKRSRFYAKDRFDISPNGVMRDPTFADIWKVVEPQLAKAAPARGTTKKATPTKVTPISKATGAKKRAGGTSTRRRTTA